MDDEERRKTPEEQQSPSRFLTQHYDGFYIGASEWRDFSAKAKANNISMIWRRATGRDSVDSVVDIGCGEGALATSLASLGFFENLTGFDISQSGIGAATARNVAGTRFAQFDGVHLPLGPQSVELALLSHVVEHLEHPRQLLSEAARVARYVFVEVPLELNARTPDDFRWTPTGHINLYNPLLIRQLVQSVGLEIVDEQVVSVGRENLRRLHGRKGNAVWALRESLVRLSPRAATAVFTYHGALLARSASPTPS